MSSGWKVTALAPRDVVRAALVAHEDAENLAEIVLVGEEQAPDKPDDWRLEAYVPAKPSKALLHAISALLTPYCADLVVEKLPDEDWLTLSQQGLEPIRAGRFYVRTPDHLPEATGFLRDFVIPAGQAFGTGHHETTAGCLDMLDLMKREGHVFRNAADIGTGTGLLAFSVTCLWPRALVTASDIDPVCGPVVLDNARTNRIPVGSGPGAVTMVNADGTRHPLITLRGPYDLVLANILAGPLIDMAPDLAKIMRPGGSLLLAGLLETQEAMVRSAARKAGLRLARRLVRGDWSILWMRKRRSAQVLYSTRKSSTVSRARPVA